MQLQKRLPKWHQLFVKNGCKNQLLNEANVTFSAYLTTWPQMTFDLDIYIWTLTSSTNEGCKVASMTQLWLKSIKACGRQSQMLTLFTTDNDNRQQGTKWSLCVFPAKGWHSKTDDTKTWFLVKNFKISCSLHHTILFKFHLHTVQTF